MKAEQKIQLMQNWINDKSNNFRYAHMYNNGEIKVGQVSDHTNARLAIALRFREGWYGPHTAKDMREKYNWNDAIDGKYYYGLSGCNEWGGFWIWIETDILLK